MQSWIVGSGLEGLPRGIAAERKFQCKIFHGRPLFVAVPKIRTSPNASFWFIWTNWDMKEMEMWPKAIMVWKYDGSRPTLPKISEVSSPGPEIWFFYKKNQWFAIDPTVQHTVMQWVSAGCWVGKTVYTHLLDPSLRCCPLPTLPPVIIAGKYILNL